MRKLLSSLLIISLNAYGAAPTGYKNETATTKTYAQDLVFPNNQLTKQAGLDSRIETGNTNLLVNPSFEHSTITTGWTVSNATALSSTSAVEGKKALSLSLTGALSLTQSSTINAANITGLQGRASIKIKTSDVTGLQVCPRNDGSTVTALCVNIPADGAWKHIDIPFILTGTSNGIAVISTGTTGTVLVDDGFVGTSSPFQNVNGAKFVGSCTTTLGSNQTATNGSYGTLTAASSISVVATGLGQSPSTNTTGCKFASLLPGDYYIVWNGEFGNSSSGQRSFFTISDGTNIAKEEAGIIGNAGYGGNTMSAKLSYLTAQTNITFIPYTKSTGGTSIILAATPQTFSVYYYPPESKIYSQASQDYDWTSYTPVSPNSSFNTISGSSCLHKRKGSDLYLRCQFTSSTVANAEQRLNLPLSGITVKAGTVVTPNGDLTFSGAKGSVDIRPCYSGGNSYMNFCFDTSAAGYAISTSTTAWAAGAITIYFESGPIPIQEWQDYGVIVGSFAGIEKCSDDFECTSEYTASMNSSQVISNQNLEGWITGNAGNPSTGIYTIPLKSGLFNVVPNCTATHISPGSNAYATKFDKTNSTTSTLRFIIMNTSTGNIVNVVSGEGFVINCQKAGVDFKPKTAKVATSIGVPTVPGITTSGTGNSIDMFSVSYGETNAGTPSATVCSTNSSNCASLDQIGNAVSSIAKSQPSGTLYTMNLNKTYAKLKCSLSAALASSESFYTVVQCKACNSVSFRTTNTANTVNSDSFGELLCQGSY